MIALIGSTHWDVIVRGAFPENGAVSVGDTTHEGAAGGTLNSASHLIDRRPLLISQIPADPHPRHAELLALMDVAGVVVPSLSAATVVIGEAGERSIFLARRPPSFPRPPARLANADVIDWHWTAPTTLLDSYASLLKGRVVCSTRSVDALRERGVHPSVIIDSLADCERLDHGQLADSGCDLCILTDGENGGSYWTEGRWTDYQAVRVQAVNAAGCGDAFRAGVLAGIDDGLTPDATVGRAARWGAKAACSSGPNEWMTAVGEPER